MIDLVNNLSHPTVSRSVRQLNLLRGHQPLIYLPEVRLVIFGVGGHDMDGWVLTIVTADLFPYAFD